MFTFSHALMLAIEIHENQKDKGGDDYIKHPLHVWYNIKENGGDEATQIVAILHDVFEDGYITADRLKISKCDDPIIEALDLLANKTDSRLIRKEADISHEQYYPSKEEAIRLKIEGEYFGYIRKLAVNKMAREVKIQDLIHNMDIKRLKCSEGLSEKDKLRLNKYKKALNILMEYKD